MSINVGIYSLLIYGSEFLIKNRRGEGIHGEGRKERGGGTICKLDFAFYGQRGL